VIHEFVHVLDMADGLADGTPLLPTNISRQEWNDTLVNAYEASCAAVDSDQATALDPYAAESLEEFFAVASEAFFVAPAALHDEHPAVYGMFKRYFQQDPLSRVAAAGGAGLSEP
jgi:hypothetical protein